MVDQLSNIETPNKLFKIIEFNDSTFNGAKLDDVVPEGEDSANRLEKKFKNNVNRPAIFVRDALEKSLESQIKYISEIEFVSTKWKVSEQLLEKCSVQNWKGN